VRCCHVVLLWGAAVRCCSVVLSCGTAVRCCSVVLSCGTAVRCCHVVLLWGAAKCGVWYCCGVLPCGTAVRCCRHVVLLWGAAMWYCCGVLPCGTAVRCCSVVLPCGAAMWYHVCMYVHIYHGFIQEGAGYPWRIVGQDVTYTIAPPLCFSLQKVTHTQAQMPDEFQPPLSRYSKTYSTHSTIHTLRINHSEYTFV
jgi:hypothetical protein